MSGRKQVPVVRVPTDFGRGAEQERALRSSAVKHGRELLAANGMKFTSNDEALAARFIDATTNYVELTGIRCV